MIAQTIVTIGAVCSASAVIIGAITKVFKRIMQPLNEQIQEMDTRECRLHLIEYMADVENGVAKDEVQTKFAHEVYDHYVNDLKQNSYVKDKWNRVITKKKL